MLYKRLIIILATVCTTAVEMCQTPLIQDPPDGIVDGVNVLSVYSAIFQLRAPGKDYVHLRGDFNGFAIPWSSALEIDVRDWLAGTYIAVQANGLSARFNAVH